jgi:hypothetical protein
MKRLMLFAVAGFFGALPTIGFAADNVPPAEPQGCHGSHTVLAKQQQGDAGHQGAAIGGNGNSDGDSTNGQAHSDAGRGAILQDFLANVCDVGSQAD